MNKLVLMSNVGCTTDLFILVRNDLVRSIHKSSSIRLIAIRDLPLSFLRQPSVSYSRLFIPSLVFHLEDAEVLVDKTIRLCLDATSCMSAIDSDRLRASSCLLVSQSNVSSGQSAAATLDCICDRPCRQRHCCAQ